jgi:LCP family protein required for cell wall assembly
VGHGAARFGSAGSRFVTPFDPIARGGGLWKRFLFGSLAIVLLSATAAAAAVLLEVKHVADLIGPATLHTAAGVITPDQAGKAETILVIGTDARKLSKSAYDRANPPHSDTLLLIRMDPNHDQTSELSVPRDLRTSITGPTGAVTMGKINEAYTIGGVNLATKTVESTLPGIAVNHIVAVNFAGFRSLIDAIGCVYVFVDRHYYNLNLGTTATNFASIDIQPGYQKLCGQPALDYASRTSSARPSSRSA